MIQAALMFLRQKTVLLFVVCLSVMSSAQAQGTGLFYYIPSDDSYASLLLHASKVPLLGPQVFMLDESGKVNGTVEERVRTVAARYGIGLMPLLANEKPESAHNMLVDPARRQQVIADALRKCEEVHCVGLQVDIEGVLHKDRGSFSEFVRQAVEAFHARNLQLSVALPTPLLTPSPKETYAQWFGGFVVYDGPYDFREIARHADFISLMTYGQFGRGTPPGPVAGKAWVEQSIRYALQFVPREKLSLGLGFWAYRWCGQEITYSGYAEVEAIRTRSSAALKWHKEHRSPWFESDVDGCRTTVWLENRRSLREKLKLARHYRLAGFSAWRLGQEDPGFWEELKETPAGKRAHKAAATSPPVPPRSAPASLH